LENLQKVELPFKIMAMRFGLEILRSKSFNYYNLFSFKRHKENPLWRLC